MIYEKGNNLIEEENKIEEEQEIIEENIVSNEEVVNQIDKECDINSEDCNEFEVDTPQLDN